MQERATPPGEEVPTEALKDGDRIFIRFFRPVADPDFGAIKETEGSVRRVAHRLFLMSETHRASWGMPACLDLDSARIECVRRLEHAAEVAARRAREALGELVFEDMPETAREFEERLAQLADMIAQESDWRIIGGRGRQLQAQFDAIADLIALARTKRSYILTRARVGQEFHPWTTADPRVFRNGTVRPLPVDFDPCGARRKDRSLRLEQAVDIFGEAEREVRVLASQLRAAGYEVRRPHPNAQELLVRIREGRSVADLVVAAGSNGYWQARARTADNKTKAIALARVLRAGHLEVLNAALDALQSETRGPNPFAPGQGATGRA